MKNEVTYYTCKLCHTWINVVNREDIEHLTNHLDVMHDIRLRQKRADTLRAKLREYFTEEPTPCE